MLAYHNFSVARALLDLFPNIFGFDKSKFRSSMFSSEAEQGRGEKGGKRRGQRANDRMSELYYYNIISLFIFIFILFWLINCYISGLAVAAVRRKFFEKYAKLHQFDPLVPNDWYRQPAYRILAEKVLHYFSFPSYKLFIFLFFFFLFFFRVLTFNF